MFIFLLRLRLENSVFFLRTVLVYFVILIILILSSVYLAQNLSKEYSANSKATQQIQDLKNQIQKTEVSSYEDTLKKSFSDQQLLNLVQKYTKYSLEINGIDIRNIKDINSIYTDNPQVSVEIKEEYDQKATDSLPKNIIDKESILKSDNINKLIKISTNASVPAPVFKDSGNEKSIDYKAEKLEHGDIVTLEIDPDFAKKIGLEDTVLEIFYK